MSDLIEEIKALICELYKLWGGDCDDLDWGDNGVSASQTIQTAYQQNGAPSFSSEQEKQDFLAMLDALESKLNDPGNTLDATATQTFLNVISGLRNDLSIDTPGGGGSGP